MSVTVSPPGTTVVARDIWPSGADSTLSVTTKANGEVFVTAQADFVGLETSETDEEGEVLAAPGQCVDGARRFFDFDGGTPGVQRGKIWRTDLPFRWWFNSNSTPPNLSVDNTEQALRDATGVWPEVYNPQCNEPDDITTSELRVSYSGRSPNASVDMNGNGGCNTGDDTDGVSRVGFGNIGSASVGTPLARACQWGDNTYTPFRIRESDFRLNEEDYDWWNTKETCTGAKFLTRGVATHERGHTFGLADFDPDERQAHANLTMVGTGLYCKQPDYSLGLGDILGLRDLYN